MNADTNDPDIIRTIIAVLGGFAIVALVVEPLELTLVRAIAGRPIADEAAYFAIRNRPIVLAVKLLYTAFAGMLGGYVAAKVAGAYEIKHAALAAAFQTFALIRGMMSPAAAFTPTWVWIALIIITAPAMLVGAWIRAAAGRKAG